MVFIFNDNEFNSTKSMEGYVMDMILGFILMFGIAMILCVGCWLANGTQDFIDEQNERLRKDQKWRDRNNG